MKHLKSYNESIKDFLKPKSKEDIRKILKEKTGLMTDKISIKIKNPLGDDAWRRYRKMLKNNNVKLEPISNIESRLTGDIVDIFNLYQYYIDNYTSNDMIWYTIKRTGEEVNESVRDLMKPISDEDIKKHFSKLNQEELDRQLYDAVRNQQMNIIKILLNMGANPNSKIKNGITILSHAEIGGIISKPNLDVIKLLLDYGADPLLPSNKGTTIPYRHAVTWKKWDIVNLFDKYIKTNESVKDLMKPIGEDKLDKLVKQFNDYYKSIFRGREDMKTMILTNFSQEEINDKLDEFIDPYDMAVWVSHKSNSVNFIYIRDKVETLNKEQLKELFYRLIGRTNESVRDLMKPKSKEDVKQTLNNMMPVERIEKIYQLRILDYYTKDEIKDILNMLTDETKIKKILKYKLLDYYTNTELRDMLDKMKDDFNIILQNDKFINLLSIEKFNELKKHIVDGLVTFYSNYHKYVSFYKDRSSGKYDMSTISIDSNKIRDRFIRHGNGIYVVLDKYDFGELKLYITKKNVAFAEISSTDYKIWSHDKIEIVLDKLVDDVLNGRREKFTVLKFDNLMR